MSKILVEKFAFDTSAHPPIYGQQTFSVSDGCLEHHIEGQLRASVPNVSVGSYLAAPNIFQALTDDERQKIFDNFSDL